jgi:hypothetical protein
MIAPTMPLSEVRQIGLEVLLERLGPVGMVRFLQQFETGYGDYTAERETWLAETDIDTLVAQIQQQRQTTEPNTNNLPGNG